MAAKILEKEFLNNIYVHLFYRDFFFGCSHAKKAWSGFPLYLFAKSKKDVISIPNPALKATRGFNPLLIMISFPVVPTQKSMVGASSLLRIA